MSADDTASPHHNNHDQNGNHNDASMVQESPSALDTSSSSTKSVPSIFDTPKTTPVQKKKRNADRGISGDRDGDNDAKRMTRSKAKTGGDMAGLFIANIVCLPDSDAILKMCSISFCHR